MGRRRDRLARREERLLWKVAGLGSRRGSSLPSRVGDITRQPLLWHAFAAALSLTGPRGRRAALRGSACSAIAVLLHLPVKRLTGRRRPRRVWLMGVPSLTSSYPSGHTANDLSFMLGAAQEMPVLAAPLTLATLGSHWSLLRSRKHYPSDIIGGGAIAFAVAAAAWVLRPPRRGTTPATVAALARRTAVGGRTLSRPCTRSTTARRTRRPSRARCSPRVSGVRRSSSRRGSCSR